MNFKSNKNTSLTRNQRFWITYSFTFLLLLPYLWWIEVPYSYFPIEWLPKKLVLGVWLFIFGVMITLLSDFETEAPNISNNGLKKFLLKHGGSCLGSKFGFILPLLLFIGIIVLTCEYKYLLITINTQESLPRSTLRVSIKNGPGNFLEDITYIIFLKKPYIYPLDDKGENWPLIIIRNEYGFFEEEINLAEIFDIKAYLLARKFDISEQLDIGKFQEPIRVEINFIPENSDAQETIHGQINPTSHTWGIFKPPAGKTIPEFFREVAKSYKKHKEKIQYTKSPHIFQVPSGSNTGIYRVEFDEEDRELILIDNSLAEETGLSPKAKDDAVELAEKAVLDNDDDAFEKFKEFFIPLTPTNKNIICEAIIKKLNFPTDWKYPKSTKEIKDFGKLLDFFSQDTSWIDRVNINDLYKISISFLHPDAGPENIPKIMISLLRFTSTPLGVRHQKDLLEKLTDLFITWANFNVFRITFLEGLSPLVTNLPSTRNIDSFIKCLRAVGYRSSKKVRKEVLDIMKQHKPRWDQNSNFQTFYNEISNQKWNLN